MPLAHDGAAAYRPFRWDTDCACLGYDGKRRPLE